jgi:hypothetical protein
MTQALSPRTFAVHHGHVQLLNVRKLLCWQGLRRSSSVTLTPKRLLALPHYPLTWPRGHALHGAASCRRDFQDKYPSQHWEDARAGFREAHAEAEAE